MSDECFLAFDTSCYTTSIAVVSDGRPLYDKRIMLSVEKGGLGLRQSEAVFQHVRNYKAILAGSPMKKYNIKGVAYSEKPRPRDDSYMPVFCVGESVALACAAALGVKAYALTHQHGHVYSAFLGKAPLEGDYCAVHVSGGTLDILRVSVKDGVIIEIAELGGTLDITCGQLIDRIGVAAGLEFPAGAGMEKLYAPGGAELSVSVSGLGVNLSGAEAQAKRLLSEGKERPYVFGGVIDCVAETLSRLVNNAAKHADLKKFVFTGGVICNRIIREKLTDVCNKNGYECLLADKAYSADNACGLALAAEILYKGERV
jgi:N6-L-threonylcarbamoyladenine synthase